MAKKKGSTGSAKGAGGSAKEEKDTGELKKVLEQLGSTISALSSTVAQGAAGSAGGALAAGTGAIAAATGSDDLAQISAILAVIAGAVDRIVEYFMPEFSAAIKVLADTEKAGKRVSALAEDAAAFGAPLSADFLKQRIAAEADAEQRRTAARIEVTNLTTDEDARRTIGKLLPWR